MKPKGKIEEVSSAKAAIKAERIQFTQEGEHIVFRKWAIASEAKTSPSES